MCKDVTKSIDIQHVNHIISHYRFLQIKTQLADIHIIAIATLLHTDVRKFLHSNVRTCPFCPYDYQVVTEICNKRVREKRPFPAKLEMHIDEYQVVSKIVVFVHFLHLNVD